MLQELLAGGSLVVNLAMFGYIIKLTSTVGDVKKDVAVVSQRLTDHLEKT